jgi:predicted aldo/keto reductase-like oxidoreductase
MKPEKKNVSRRDFLCKTAALSSLPVIASCTGSGKQPLSADISQQNQNLPASGKPTADVMPLRAYGNTGICVSVLGFGCGSAFRGLSDADKGAALDVAIAGGVNYIDCASEYGTTAFIGTYFAANPTLRKSVYISTKLNSRDLTGAKNELASELTKLKLPYVDVALCHALPSDLNLTSMNSATGAWTYLLEAKKTGLAKFIGWSSMDTTAATTVCPQFITQLKPDVCTMAMQAGNGYAQFKTTTLPVANAAGCGVAAIKTTGGLVSAANPVEKVFAGLCNLKDTKGNPAIATLIVGHAGGPTQVTKNIAAIKTVIAALNETNSCSTGVLSFNFEEIDRIADLTKGPHNMPWLHPDYRDNGLPYYWS